MSRVLISRPGRRYSALQARVQHILQEKGSQDTRQDRSGDCQEQQAIIVNEIPYQVNKSLLIEEIADLVRDKA